jgi:diguanylate cyclase (GGDEF)-like protein
VLPRAVTPVSLCYPQMLCIFVRFFRKFGCQRHRASRFPSHTRILNGPRSSVFINSKPQPRLAPAVEGPLIDAVAANKGARLAGAISVFIMAMYAVRAAGLLLGIDFSFSHSTNEHAGLVLVLMFLSMSINFGFLLMAMDRLRNEVADLALIDDLTGVGNRRHLMQRLTEECARSVRSGEPFALLVIDLDGFKAINDTHGHATGDACLQHFTLMAQTRLRPSDLLARSGGDEFCVVLPSSTLHQGALIARRVLEVCRRDAEGCAGTEIPIEVSIGIAQWTTEIGLFPDRLIAGADSALYAAKKEGKNRYAAYNPSPPLAPEQGAMPLPALR